jgi:hypothetical protein
MLNSYVPRKFTLYLQDTFLLNYNPCYIFFIIYFIYLTYIFYIPSTRKAKLVTQMEGLGNEYKILVEKH